MTGKKDTGKSHGGKRAYAGRPSGSVRNALDRKALALAASEYTMEALSTMVELMRNAKNESTRLMAAERIIDRAVGRAPMNLDISALRHDEIVYESVQQIREELERRGVPPVLIEHMRDVTPSEDQSSDSDA